MLFPSTTTGHGDFSAPLVKIPIYPLHSTVSRSFLHPNNPKKIQMREQLHTTKCGNNLVHSTENHNQRGSLLPPQGWRWHASSFKYYSLFFLKILVHAICIFAVNWFFQVSSILFHTISLDIFNRNIAFISKRKLYYMYIYPLQLESYLYINSGILVSSHALFNQAMQ